MKINGEKNRFNQPIRRVVGGVRYASSVNVALAVVGLVFDRSHCNSIVVRVVLAEFGSTRALGNSLQLFGVLLKDWPVHRHVAAVLAGPIGQVRLGIRHLKCPLELAVNVDNTAKFKRLCFCLMLLLGFFGLFTSSFRRCSDGCGV